MRLISGVTNGQGSISHPNRLLVEARAEPCRRWPAPQDKSIMVGRNLGKAWLNASAQAGGVKNWAWPLAPALAADSKNGWKMAGFISVFMDCLSIGALAGLRPGLSNLMS